MAKRAPGDAAHTAFVGVEFARSPWSTKSAPLATQVRFCDI
jgi:hypothetical protein